MVFDFQVSVKEYAEKGKDNKFPSIRICVHCQSSGKIIGYGYYSRWCHQYLVWVRRYFCKSCSKTFGLLPCFLCRGISESLEVVEKMLWHRSREETYKECMEGVSRQDLSYQRIQYWVKRWDKKSKGLKASLPLKEMTKPLGIFSHLSHFFHLNQDSGKLFEAANLYLCRHFYRCFL